MTPAGKGPASDRGCSGVCVRVQLMVSVELETGHLTGSCPRMCLLYQNLLYYEAIEGEMASYLLAQVQAATKHRSVSQLASPG